MMVHISYLLGDRALRAVARTLGVHPPDLDHDDVCRFCAVAIRDAVANAERVTEKPSAPVDDPFRGLPGRDGRLNR